MQALFTTESAIRLKSMYNYAEIKPALFTEEGQVRFLAIRDNVHKLLRAAGAVRMSEAIQNTGCGDSWTALACVDRLVELKEIRELVQKDCAQHRVFVEA